jgi:D-beta-D-heptose 7-phosphate kinase/D-beta-D-heptose 1-phosphate adenosyltransferase
MVIVWMNGCFDVLHYGHFRMIKHAASLGDKLVIGIDSDRRVKELKGESRPFHNQEQREFNLKQLKEVDQVMIFDSEEELRNILDYFTPDIFVIGSDYKDKPIIGSEFVKEIVYFDRIEGFSTSNILNYGKTNGY